MAFVSILEKIDLIIMAPHCTNIFFTEVWKWCYHVQPHAMFVQGPGFITGEVTRGGGYLTNFLGPSFNVMETLYVFNITSIFGRCQCRYAVVTSAKYEYYSLDVTDTFAKTKNVRSAEVIERNFSDPHPSAVIWFLVPWVKSLAKIIYCLQAVVS